MPLYLGNKLVSGQTRPIDGAVTQDSKNLITSGAVKTYVDDIVDDLATEIPIQDQEPSEGNLWIDTSEDGAIITPEEIGAVTQEQLNEAISGIQVPVESVNGKTGTVQLSAGDVGAPTVAEMNSAIAAIPTPDVSGQIGLHDSDPEAHSSIREAVSIAQTTAAAAYQSADNRVPVNRKINGKMLAEDITLYTYGTEDLVAGSSPLETGKLHFVYE